MERKSLEKYISMGSIEGTKTPYRITMSEKKNRNTTMRINQNNVWRIKVEVAMSSYRLNDYDDDDDDIEKLTIT